MDERPPRRPHIGERRRYLRDVVLGVNDGLVSMFLLVAGVVGGSLTTSQVLLAGVAGAFAGAISMGAGEYLATKSQEEAHAAELEVEAEHLHWYRDEEIAELREMFGEMGLAGEDLERVVTAIAGNDEAMLQVMAGLEFGIVEHERRSPLRAAWLSGLLFVVGSMPPVLPFFFDPAPTTGLVAAAVMTGIALFVVGWAKTRMTRRSPWVAGLENLTIGLVGAAASYLVGRVFGVAVIG
ncbi:MAG TPA: hypothetical protein ENK55_04695 [Actinobacteria bacterium]|nr:hypothetical protein [Actinomycetota bacterium]